jgi:hypothetical protein
LWSDEVGVTISKIYKIKNRDTVVLIGEEKNSCGFFEAF